MSAPTNVELPPRAWSSLAALATALLLGMATWFSAGAVIPQLQAEFLLGTSAAAWLTIGVQFGFVLGAVGLALSSVSDRVGPRALMAMGAVSAALANALLLVVETGIQAILVRIITGTCLAALYPPAMKAISTWFPRARGTAIGVMIGALTLGSASPHLVAALGGLDWKVVVIGTSALSASGGMVALFLARDGPHAFPQSRFRLKEALRAFSSRPVALASIGYFGHMWELYAMWSWFALFFGQIIGGSAESTSTTASLITFCAVGVGALGSLLGGRLAEKLGSARVAMFAMGISGACAISIGWLGEGPVWLVAAIGIIWGFWVIPDSAQLSSIVTHVGDQRYVGSMLTLQMAGGYLVTVPVVWLTPLIAETTNWGVAFSLLALGPLAGLVAVSKIARPTNRRTP